VVEGWLLPESIGKQEHTVNLLIDRTYEDNRIRLIAGELEFNPVVSVETE
jgi:hypothetical protein